MLPVVEIPVVPSNISAISNYPFYSIYLVCQGAYTYRVDESGTVIVDNGPIVTGPNIIAFTFAETVAFLLITFGVAQALANVNVPELNTAVLATLSAEIVTGPSAELTKTLLVPLKILSELTLSPVS
jgi:hypothetical protein